MLTSKGIRKCIEMGPPVGDPVCDIVCDIVICNKANISGSLSPFWPSAPSPWNFLRDKSKRSIFCYDICLWFLKTF